MKIDKKTILLLYRTGRIDISGVKKALEKGWITEEEYVEITGQEI